MKVVEEKDIDWTSDEPVQVVGDGHSLVKFIRPASLVRVNAVASLGLWDRVAELNPFVSALRRQNGLPNRSSR